MSLDAQAQFYDNSFDFSYYNVSYDVHNFLKMR